MSRRAIRSYHYHASGTVAHGQVRTDGLVVQSLPVFLDLWYPGADSISAAIAETGHGQTPWVVARHDGGVRRGRHVHQAPG